MAHKPGAGPVRLRIALRGDEVELRIDQSRPVLLSARLLAELVVDLKSAGRMLVQLPAAAEYVGRIGRERHGAPETWAPILTPEEMAAAEVD